MSKELVDQAKASPRLCEHKNIHTIFQEPSRRLFNAIKLGSHIRPHKHESGPRDEMLVAVRVLAAGMELPANARHTVVALVPDCVMLIDPNQPKELAPWAPE
jgi:hypothetical protein